MTEGMTGAKAEALERILDRAASVRGSLILALHEAQELYGYLPADVQLRIAERLSLPQSTVRGVVTFYNFFRTEPRGRHMISVCTGTACHVKGAERVLDHLREELGVGVGETTADGRFTVQAVRCIGACGLAPVMMVDHEVYGKLDRKRVKAALARHADA
ncbi:MAG: NADH-quinone oxidoreductase subunit NuoE [Candidatus Bipolaricaulota bacterium]